jgi:hypothetical protein
LKINSANGPRKLLIIAFHVSYHDTKCNRLSAAQSADLSSPRLEKFLGRASPRMARGWMARRGRRIVAWSGVEWCATADEDGHYCFAVAL